MNEKCFGIRKHRMCSVLIVKSCPGYAKCPFYKPLWMYLRDQSRINVRLCGMPKEEQEYIAHKYYRGEMPWKGGCE